MLPTLTAAAVAAFQDLRYVRSLAVLGVPSGATVDPGPFAALPPRLSASPVPTVTLPLPEDRVLVVHAEGQRCVVAGHPASPDPADALAAAALSPGDVVSGARRETRRVASLPVPPEQQPQAVLGEVLRGGWFPLWQASRVLAPEATIPPARVLSDELLALHPWPSLARPLVVPTGAATSDVTTTRAAPAALDATLAAWLTPAEVRAVVVLPADAPRDLESLGAPVVQPAVTPQEIFR
ncbi:MAG: hypothetical protein ACK4YP_00765 [Myxococcota bacterium]